MLAGSHAGGHGGGLRTPGPWQRGVCGDAGLVGELGQQRQGCVWLGGGSLRRLVSDGDGGGLAEGGGVWKMGRGPERRGIQILHTHQRPLCQSAGLRRKARWCVQTQKLSKMAFIRIACIELLKYVLAAEVMKGYCTYGYPCMPWVTASRPKAQADRQLAHLVGRPAWEDDCFSSALR